MAVLPTPGGDLDTWGTILNTFLTVCLNNDGTINTGALQTALTAAQPIILSLLDLGDTTAGIARSNDSGGNPQVVLFAQGTSPASVTLDSNGFRPTPQGSPPIPLGSSGSPWNTAFITAFGQTTLGVDGTPLVTTKQMNAAIAAAITGTPVVPGAPTLNSVTPSSNSAALSWTAPSNTGGSSITGWNVMRGTASGQESLLVPTIIEVQVSAKNGSTASGSAATWTSTPATSGNGLIAAFIAATQTDYPTAVTGCGGSWVQISEANGVALWYTPTNTSGTTITATMHGAGVYYVCVMEAQNLGPLLGGSVATNNTTSTGPASLTLIPQAGQLAIALASIFGAATFTGSPSSPWTNPQTGEFINANGAGFAYDIAGSTGSQTASWTMSGSQPWATLGCVFVPGIPAGATSFTDITVVNGTTYFFEMQAVNTQGASASSNEISVTPLASNTAPGAPTLNSAIASAGQVVLNWTLNPNNGGASVTSQKVLRSTSPGGETLLHTISDGTTLTYTDTTVSNGTTYYFEIESVNSVGTSAASGELSASPISSGMSPPVGFSVSNQIFEDNFSGSSIDSSKWTVGIGQASLWNNNGNLGAGYSGANMPGAASVALYNASQISVTGGVCTFTAQPYSGTYASQGYQWISGALTTLQKFTIPSSYSQWWAQARVFMPDTSAGMWPAFWFLGPGSGQEIDGYEGGWLATHPNQQGHSDFFANQGQHQNVWATVPTSTNVNAGYHIYGVNFIVGTSCTFYFDNNVVYTVAAGSNTTMAAVTYTMMLTLQVAASSTSGWHTTGGSTNQTMVIDEVQVYAK